MNQSTRLKPLFHPGRLLVTPAAHTALHTHGIPVISVLLRHICGDWGDLCDEDLRQNDLSLEAGFRRCRATLCRTREASGASPSGIARPRRS